MHHRPAIRFFVAMFCWGMLCAAISPPALASIEAKGEWVFPPYTKEGGLGSNYVYAIKINAAGEVWCCAGEGSDQEPLGGISKYIGSPQRKPPEWAIYNKSNGLPDSRIYSFDFDAAGNIWLAMQKGVAKIDGSGAVLYAPKEFEGLPMRCIDVGPNGDVWAAKGSSSGNGPALYRFDGSGWHRYDANSVPYPNGPLDFEINALAVDQRGNVWIGTVYGGASKFDPSNSSWTNYGPSNSGLPHYKVNAIAFDGSGNVWFGTAMLANGTGGAAKLNPSNGSWTQQSVGHTDVMSIAVSAEHGIWFGTRTEGVYLFDVGRPPDKQWVHFNTTTTEHGLPNDDVRGVVYDNAGRVWFATLSGGVGCLLAKSIPQLTAQGPEAAPSVAAAVAETQSGTGEPGSQSATESQAQANNDIKKLAMTGMELLRYLCPGLFLILIGLGSGSRRR